MTPPVRLQAAKRSALRRLCAEAAAFAHGATTAEDLVAAYQCRRRAILAVHDARAIARELGDRALA